MPNVQRGMLNAQCQMHNAQMHKCTKAQMLTTNTQCQCCLSDSDQAISNQDPLDATADDHYLAAISFTIGSKYVQVVENWDWD